MKAEKIFLCSLLSLLTQFLVFGGENKNENNNNDIPSIDTIKKDNMGEGPTKVILLKFLSTSETWDTVQNSEGVEKILGKPTSKWAPTVSYRSRGDKVAEIWEYRVSQSTEFTRVLIGFNSKGRTLYAVASGETVFP